jgi:hypothetical protein
MFGFDLMTDICFKSPPPISAANTSSGTTGTISEEHIRASLLSAVEDKLRRRLREQFSQIQAELETLRRTEQELTQGRDKQDDILARLEREQVIYESMIILKWILRGKGNKDTLVVSNSSWYVLFDLSGLTSSRQRHIINF